MSILILIIYINIESFFIILHDLQSLSRYASSWDVTPYKLQVISMPSSLLEQTQHSLATLNEFEHQRLTQALKGLTRQQINWASGYLAGLSQTQLPEQQEIFSPCATILYATHTGNGRGIADQLAEDAKQQGLNTRVLSINDYKPRNLTRERLLILVISTHGEGEPPETAQEFQRYLFNRHTPQLEQLNFSVFALGDSSYEFFCQAGIDVDLRLEALGATRLLPRIDADINFQQEAQNWRGDVIQQSRKHLTEHTAKVFNLSGASSLPGIDRSNPYQATVLDKRRITTDQGIANIHHIVLEIDPQVIRYQPGDALGVWSKNNPALVADIIQFCKLDAETPVHVEGQQFSLEQALQNKLELTLLHPTVVANWANLSGSEKLLSLADDARKLREFAQDRQLIDLISEFPAQVEAEALINVLQPLQPRLYSIASSQQQNDDEVHLTVAALSFDAHGRSHQGTASSHLVHRLQQHDVLAVYVAENTHFRLPVQGDTPIIMIGAGTGIAPYRAFLQQRQCDAASGKNWLIFGNRHFKRDFLYQQDWINFRKAGLLDKVSLAFSRDTTTRAYIQDKLREEGQQFYEWLQQGAHVYVCGGIEMEKAVRESIAEIVNQYGEQTEQQADVIIENLRSQGRYLRDVY